MTTHEQAGPRRLRAALVGLGLDGTDGLLRIIQGSQSLMVGGSAETQSEMVEVFLRLESELERLGRGLADFEPTELLELAWRIDLPELMEIAVRLRDGVAARGGGFRGLSAEELTDLAAPLPSETDSSLLDQV